MDKPRAAESRLDRPLAVAIRAAAVARDILLAERARADGPRGEIGHCPADDEAERAIRTILQSEFPSWGYLGEETGASSAGSGENYVWFVDPNDGTSSMQRGYRGHAVAIGLIRDGLPVLGVVWAVDAPDDDGDLIAWAQGCGPIRRNGVALPPREWPDGLESNAIVGVSLAANRNPVGYLAAVAPARCIGVPSIAYRLALVAAGDHVATNTLNYARAWDVMAGHALIRAAGGVVLDDEGHEITYPREGFGDATRVFAGGRNVVRQLLARDWEGVTRSGFGDAAPPPELAPVRARPGRLVHDASVLRRAQGCLLGQLAGDALGALVEFESSDAIARHYPAGGPRQLASGGPHRIIAGQPTDDSELALALGRTLVARDDLDFAQESVATAYAGWYHGWTHSLEPVNCPHDWCRPFDCGGTTSRALGAVSADDVRRGGAAARAISAAHQQSQANGALMRISPLGVWGTFREPFDVAAAARQDAELTHPHPVCQSTSEVFAVTLAAIIRDRLDPAAAYSVAISQAAEPSVRYALESARSRPPADFMSKQGWVLVALQNAFYRLLHASNVEEGVVATVRCGGDTDTNAAICGALLGAIHGRDSIPEQWRQMVLTCRPMPGHPGVRQPRPALYWPTDALVLAERLLDC